MINVSVHYKGSSQPINYGECDSAYEKGAFYCVVKDGKVFKHPVRNIWRISESYGESQRDTK